MMDILPVFKEPYLKQIFHFGGYYPALLFLPLFLLSFPVSWFRFSMNILLELCNTFRH